MNTAPWFVLVATPQLEFKAESAIRERGYSAVVPFEEKELRAQFSRKLNAVPEPKFRKMPLFRGYTIVQAEHQDDIGQLLYQMSRAPRRLVSNVLRYDGKYGPPSPLPPQCMEYLNEISGRRVRSNLEIAPLKIGDVARIASEHAFAGQQSTVISKTKTGAKMLIEVLASMRVVEIQDRYLQRVEIAPQIRQSA